jgi:hypothetical protein
MRGPRRIRRWTPHSCMGSPLPPRKSRSIFVSKVAVEMESRAVPLPRIQTDRQADVAVRIHLVAHPRSKSPLSNQKTKEVACAISRRCTAPREPSHVEHPAAIRCKPSRHTLSLPQAPSSPTQSHTALDVAEQHQAPWSAASSQATTM